MAFLENKRRYKGRINSSYRLDRDVKAALNEAARRDKNRRTVSDIVNDALRSYPAVAAILSEK